MSDETQYDAEDVAAVDAMILESADLRNETPGDIEYTSRNGLLPARAALLDRLAALRTRLALGTGLDERTLAAIYLVSQYGRAHIDSPPTYRLALEVARVTLRELDAARGEGKSDA